MNEKKLKDIKRRSYNPTEPHKDFPPHYERHRPFKRGKRGGLTSK